MFINKCGEYEIPLLDPKEPITDDYVDNHLQPAIKSDGCTVVSELYHECCVVHDLGYEFGIDPWGNKVTKTQTDTNFRRCMQMRAKLGRFAPIPLIRYIGVTLFGGLFKHSKGKCNE
jgi:hypothetical protein